jgi:hypothetical protein
MPQLTVTVHERKLRRLACKEANIPGSTLSELAGEIGVSGACLSRWEALKRVPEGIHDRRWELALSVLEVALSTIQQEDRDANTRSN